MGCKSVRFILFVFLLGWLCANVVAGDFVYRPEVALSGPVIDDLRWTASLEPQLTSDSQQAGEISVVCGMNWKLMEHVKITPQYKYVAKGTDPGSNETRPRIGVEFDGKVLGVKLAFRNRFEYRMKEDKDEYWRYRARAKIKFPKVGLVTPFMYEEVFHEFGETDKINGNEAGVGIGLPLGDQLALEVNLRYCHSRSDGGWGSADTHLLTVLKYAF